MKSNFIIYVRECLHSNSALQKVLFIYSAILVLLGGQLPKIVNLIIMFVATLFFVIWFIIYSSVNKSKEFLKTLPSSNRCEGKARLVAALTITFPFYAVSILSALAQKGDQGFYPTPLNFTVKTVVVLAVYVVVYKLLLGKTYHGSKNYFFIKLRVLATIICLALIGVLQYAMQQNSSYYNQINQLEEATLLVPDSYKDMANYKCENADKVIVNLRVDHFENPTKNSYCSSKVFDLEEFKNRKILLSEFDESPQWLTTLFLNWQNGKVDINNMSQASNRSWSSGTTDFTTSTTTQYGFSYGSLPEKLWIRRLFSCSEFSILSNRRVIANIIPFNSKESLHEIPLPKQKYRTFYDNNGVYIESILRKYERVENKILNKVVVKKDGSHHYGGRQFHRNPRNFLANLPILYLLILLVLISGFGACGFGAVKMFCHLLLTVLFFIYLDYQLVLQRLNVVEMYEENPIGITFATADLNNSIYFRDYGARKLKILGEKLARENRRVAAFSCKSAWLALVNRKNSALNRPLIDRYQFFYDMNLTGKNDLYFYALENDMQFNLGKIINKPGAYHENSWRNLDLFFIKPTFFTVNHLAESRNKRDYHFKPLFDKLKKMPKEKLINSLKNKPLAFAYVVHNQAGRYRDLLRFTEKGKGYISKFDEVIEVSEEAQIKMVLDYFNKK